MVGIGVFLGVITFAVLIGAAAFWLLRRYSLWVTIPATIFLSLCTVIGASVIFLIAFIKFPASDDRNWSELDKVELLVDSSKKSSRIDDRAVRTYRRRFEYSSGSPNEFNPPVIKSADLHADYALSISFPAQTPSGDDITIVLTVSARSTPLPTGELRAVLRSQNLKVWTTQSCASAPKSVDGLAACSTVTSHNSVNFIWTASPAAQGVRQLAIEFPAVWQGSEWSAILAKNSVPVSGGANYTPLLLSTSSPTYGSPRGDFSVDVSRRDIRFPIKVLTSLGLSAYTYGVVGVIGVALAGALGSGWVFRLIELITSRSRKAKHQPLRPIHLRREE
jgi:hypothetical protein